MSSQFLRATLWACAVITRSNFEDRCNLGRVHPMFLVAHELVTHVDAVLEDSKEAAYRAWAVSNGWP